MFEMRVRISRLAFLTLVLLVAAAPRARAQGTSADQKLAGFDAYMGHIMKDWSGIL